MVSMSSLLRTWLTALFHLIHLRVLYHHPRFPDLIIHDVRAVCLQLLSPVGATPDHHQIDQVEGEGPTNDHVTTQVPVSARLLRLRLRGLFRPRGEPVILNVYDLYWVPRSGSHAYTPNTILHWGVFHSGIEVYGTEFAYGCHPFPSSGIFEITPREQFKYVGQFEFRFKQSIHLGYTELDEETIRLKLVRLGNEWRGDHYHPTNKNCNHFTEALVQILVGKNEIPMWVNRLSYVLSCNPILQLMCQIFVVYHIHQDYT